MRISSASLAAALATCLILGPANAEVVTSGPNTGQIAADWHALDTDDDALGEASNANSENGIVGTLGNGNLGRWLVTFDLDDNIDPNEILSVTLHLRLKAVFGTPPANASLWHSQSATVGGLSTATQRSLAYHEASFADTGADIFTPASATGSFYSVDVTNQVLSDINQDAGDVLSIFRVQIDGIDRKSDLAPNIRYMIDTTNSADSSRHPYLELEFRPPSCLLTHAPSVPVNRWISSANEPVDDVVISFENTSIDPLNFTVLESPDATWLTLPQTSGILSAGQQTQVVGQIDPAGLAPGTYSANLLVTDDCPDSSARTIEVNLIHYGTGRPDPDADAPNIVYILIDDMGYGSCGVYGADPNLIQTPSIDRLAAEGTLFTNACTPVSVCTPTRYSVLYGRYSWRTRLKHGVIGVSQGLLPDPGRTSLASWLRARGYFTAAIGKWHLGYLGFDGQSPADWFSPLTPGPADIGFDYHFAVPQNHDDLTGIYIEQTAIWGLLSTALNPFGPNSYGNNYRGYDAPQRVNENVMAEQTSRAIHWMQQQVSEQRKFFLYFTPVAVHEPITPSATTVGTSAAGPYGDFLHDVEESVTQILVALDTLGIGDDTIVVFTSDNGGLIPGNGTGPEWDAIRAGLDINGNLRGSKTLVWEGGTRVPCIIRWPGKIAAGNSSDAIVNLSDSFATIAELVEGPGALSAGVAPDSFSFASVLRDSDAVRATTRKSTIAASSLGITAIRRGPWKYIDGEYADTVPVGQQNPNNAQASPQLYHLEQDPLEANDLLTQQPEIAAQLQRELTAIETADSSQPYPSTTAEDCWALTDIRISADSGFIENGSNLKAIKLFDAETYDFSDGIDLADIGTGAAIFSSPGSSGTVDYIEWQVEAGPISLDEIFFRCNHDAITDPNQAPERSLSRIRILADTDPSVVGYETVLVDDLIVPVYELESGNLLTGTSLAKVYPIQPIISAKAFRAEFTRAGSAGPRLTELSAAVRIDCTGIVPTIDEILPCLLGPNRWLGPGCYCSDIDKNGSFDMRDVAVLQSTGL